MSEKAKNQMYEAAVAALKAADIEVVSCEPGGRDRYKIKVRADSVEATIFTPFANKAVTRTTDGKWPAELVSSARRTLVLRGAKFDRPAPGQHTVVAFSRADRANVSSITPSPEPVEAPAPLTAPVTLGGIAEVNRLVVAATEVAASPSNNRKAKVYLSEKEKGELYASSKNGDFTIAELADLYNIADNTVRNIIKAGERGELIDAALQLIAAEREPAPEVPKPDAEETEVSPGAVYVADPDERLRILVELNAVQARLAELQLQADTVGLKVTYSIKTEWSK